MARILLPLLLLVRFVAAPAGAHTTDFLGGRLSLRADGVVELRLEIPADRLSVYGGELPGAYRSVADVRAAAPLLSGCFLDSLVVYSGGREVAPARVEWPLLDRGANDAAALPEFVTVQILWTGLPFLPATVIPRFDLTETYVMLILDESLAADPAAVAGGSAASPGSWAQTFGRALVVGYEHILPLGLDHILFVLGLFFAVRRVRDLVAQVTMFTVAHSITLGLAMGGVVALGDTWSRVVEIGIAVSIVAVAVENCLIRESPGWRRLAIVGVFGLVHGLGFAGALSEINWPADRFVSALLAANLGIELGQLTVVGVAALITAWVWRRDWYRGWIAVPASVAIGLCGLYWAVERIV
jgi:hydrogenase/urease accessory protein HupE